MKRSKNAKEYQRLHIIQLSSKGKTVPELADLFNRGKATIRDDIKRYNPGGLNRLKRQSSLAAPVPIPLNQTPWEALLYQSPSQFELLNTAARNGNQDLSLGHANPWYALFGRWVYLQGSGWYTIHERKRHQEVQAHWQRWLDSEPDTFWLRVMDKASAHPTPKLTEFWQHHRDRLSRVSLPTYSPHLNLIERFWWVMRGQMLKNHFYPSLKDLAEAVVQWLETLPIHRFCSLMGIHEVDP